MSDEKPVRLLLVDDNPAVHRQVLQLLPPIFEVVDVLEDGAGLRAAVESHHPDIVVLDITLPGQSGIAAAAELARTGAAARVVFMTVHNDADYMRAALAVGACGYIVKMRMSLDLVPALTAAMAGRRFVSPLPELAVD